MNLLANSTLAKLVALVVVVVVERHARLEGLG